MTPTVPGAAVVPLARLTAGGICRALRLDADPDSGLIHSTRGGVAFPREFWLAGARLWVRERGTYVTGYLWSGEYAAQRFTGFAAWRIRRAFRVRLAIEAAARLRG